MHQCTERLKNFTQYKNYKRHVAKLHPEKLPDVASKRRKSLEFKCSQCTRQFSTNQNFKAHVNQKHKNESVIPRGPAKINCALCQSEIIKVDFEKHLHTNTFLRRHLTLHHMNIFLYGKMHWKTNQPQLLLKKVVEKD